MSAYSEHAAGLVELQDELGDDCPVITYRSAVIKILPSSVSHAKKLDLGGFTPEVDLSFTALLADFPQTPLPQESFTYNSRRYNIESVATAPEGLQVRITASDANKGA